MKTVKAKVDLISHLLSTGPLGKPFNTFNQVRWTEVGRLQHECNMLAEGTQSKSSFSIKLYIFNQGDGNSIAATSQTL